jgi:hypothetical protein
MMMSLRNRLAVAQGAFDLVTGIWPLVDMRSFTAVTGPKKEHWLVKTVGVLIGVVGGVLVAAGRRDRVTPEVAALGAGTALALAAIDVVYVAKRRISPVYLVDAIVETAFATTWAASGRKRAM